MSLVNLFENTQLASVLNRYPIVCIDVGCRGGFEQDLLPIAFGVNGIGFEPDPIAFDALRCKSASPWRSMRHLPAALGRNADERQLNITVHPGSSSFLEHDPSIGRRFNKPDFFEVKSKVKIRTQSLDEVLAAVGPISPAYIKLDVEGFEIEVLQGALSVMSDLVALKIEVSFLPFRRGQPLAPDVDFYVRQRGFELVDLLNPVYWRIFEAKSENQNGASIAYSRGQLAHADYLFFRNIETLKSNIKRFEAALLAMNYGFFDHAATIVLRPQMASWLQTQGIASPIDMVAEASAKFNLALQSAKPSRFRGLLRRCIETWAGPRFRRAQGIL